MEVTQSAATTTSQYTTQSEEDKSNLDSDFDTFLKMLTTQITNQDPSAPMDSSDFASQLATFSSVEQAVRTNELLESMVAQYGGSGISDVASWVGMEARVGAPALFDGSPVTLFPEPLDAAEENFLVVRNADGDIVQTTEVPNSTDPIEWAGVDENGDPLPEGLYSFSMNSYAEDELINEAQIDVYTRITEARAENGATVLVLQGGTMVPSANVTGLREATL